MGAEISGPLFKVYETFGQGACTGSRGKAHHTGESEACRSGTNEVKSYCAGESDACGVGESEACRSGTDEGKAN